MLGEEGEAGYGFVHHAATEIYSHRLVEFMAQHGAGLPEHQGRLGGQFLGQLLSPGHQTVRGQNLRHHP